MKLRLCLFVFVLALLCESTLWLAAQQSTQPQQSFTVPSTCQAFLKGKDQTDLYQAIADTAQFQLKKHNDLTAQASTDLRSCILKLESMVPEASSSPVTVHGGTMTARTSIRDNQGWMPRNQESSSYCTNVDTSTAYVVQGDGTCTLVPLPSKDWILALHGGSPITPGAPTDRGLLLTAQNQACNSHSSGTSVQLTVFNDGGTPGSVTSFYRGDSSDDGKRDKHRFLDQTPDGTSATQAGCINPLPGDHQHYGDEDTCERLMSIEIRGSTSKPMPCDDCTLYIGTPDPKLQCQ